jgi:hypothetical protein
MFGLMVLLAFVVYLLISIGVVKWAVRYARKHDRSAKRWGWSAALVMYLIPFWDWLPTVATHQYYCATESGFWVYKTLDQWKQENPGVMEGLHQILQPNQRMPYGDLSILDERFAIETHRRKPVPFLSTSISQRLLVDRKTGDLLAKGVDVGSGIGNMATGGGMKFWLNQKPCIAQGIWELSTEIQNMRGQK